ncbi:hypothetical protein A9G38_04340 [Gilliamella sp. Imp1-1]|nr:hypothetical protein A9G38_04340 [Gilliamella apicola]
MNKIGKDELVVTSLLSILLDDTLEYYKTHLSDPSKSTNDNNIECSKATLITATVTHKIH